MKHLLNILLGLSCLGLATSCEKDLTPYSDPQARLNFTFYSYNGEPILSSLNSQETESFYSFKLKSSVAGKELTSDTVWFEVATMGFLSEADRTVELEQIEADTLTNAVPGVHYVKFDEPQLLAKSFVPAGQNTAKIPVVLLRDASLKTQDIVLRFTFKSNSYFVPGYKDFVTRTLFVTDRLSKPTKWNTYYLDYTFGEYGAKKHELMIAWTGKAWDDDYLDELFKGDPGYMDYMDQWFQRKLEEENKKRTEQGLDVYREDSSDGKPGKAVSFKPLSWM